MRSFKHLNNQLDLVRVLKMPDHKTEERRTELIKSRKAKKISPLEQLRSQRQWNLERLNKAFMRARYSRKFFDFLTAGTSGKRPEEFLNVLKLPVFSCNLLVDVRINPYSRHTPYWNKYKLLELCRAREIDYVHMPHLGVPKNIRKIFLSGQMAYDQLFSWYDDNVLIQENLEKIVEIVHNKNTTFMCTEISPAYCHRHRIALRLEELLDFISFDL